MENVDCSNIQPHWQANFIRVLNHGRTAVKCFLNETTQENIYYPIAKELTHPAKYLIYALLSITLLCILSTLVTLFENIRRNAVRIATALPSDTDIPAKKNGEKLEPDKGSTCLSDGSFSSDIRQFLKCFCLITNTKQIFSLKFPKHHMVYMDGIRVYSLLWIFACHVNIVLIIIIRNLEANQHVLAAWPMQFFYGGNLAVDVFFLLSGFLNARSFFEKYNSSNGKINWFKYYLHRIFRLTPAYAVTLGCYTLLYPYSGSGPIWPTFNINPVCQNMWWTNLLYVNNLVPLVNMCMTWGWYLSVDFQYFAISPLILVALLRKPKIGYTIIGLLLGASIYYNFYLKYYFGIMSTFEMVRIDYTKFVKDVNLYFDAAYTKPLNRICPYLVGIVLAYFLHNRQPKKPVDAMTLKVGWCMAACAYIYCFFGIHYENPSLIAESIHLSIKHLVYACSIAWIVFACYTKNGGIAYYMVSSKYIVPISRLSYSAYLINGMLLYYYECTAKNTIEFNLPLIIYIMFASTAVIFALAYFLAVVIENPFIRLWSFIDKKTSQKKIKHS